MQPTLMTPPSSQSQGNSFVNFQNGGPNQQATSITDPGFSNQFAHINLNSGSTADPGSNPPTSKRQTPESFTPASQSFASPTQANPVSKTPSSAGMNLMTSNASFVNSLPMSLPATSGGLQSPQGMNGLFNQSPKSFNSPQPNLPVTGLDRGPGLSMSQPPTSFASPPQSNIGDYSHPQSLSGRPTMVAGPASNLEVFQGGQLGGQPYKHPSNPSASNPIKEPVASLTQQAQNLSSPKLESTADVNPLVLGSPFTSEGMQSPRGMNGFSAPPSTLKSPSGLSNEPPKSFSNPQSNASSYFGGSQIKGVSSSFGTPLLSGASVGPQPNIEYSNSQSPLARQPTGAPASNLGSTVTRKNEEASEFDEHPGLPASRFGGPSSALQTSNRAINVSQSNSEGLTSGFGPPPTSNSQMANPPPMQVMGTSTTPSGRRPQYAHPVASQLTFPPQQQPSYPSQQTDFSSSQQSVGFSPQTNTGLPPQQQTNALPPPQQNTGFPPAEKSGLPPPTQPGIQGGFPPQKTSGFPPPQQSSRLPPSTQSPGFPPALQNSRFPTPHQNSGFPPTQPVYPLQQSSGFPPTQPGFPLQQNTGFPLPQQNSALPPTQPGFPPTQQRFPPPQHQNTVFPPSQPNSALPATQPALPPTQPRFPSPQRQNSGFPPAQPGLQNSFPPQQPPGFPPLPQGVNYPGLQSPPGFPPQPSRPGYPTHSQSGYPQGPGGHDQQAQDYSGMQYPNMRPQPPPQKKLDPDNMPSRIQVMEDDRKSRSGEFRTDQRGGLPPLVTTPFTVQDQGNCSPRFVRATMYSVPTTSDLMKQVGVPLGLVLSPLARVLQGEMEPPEADFSQSGGPVRCGRCKAYMSPFMQFVDGGRRFHCPMCKATSEVPETYFAHMDAMGQRMDKYQRPELCLGSYELIVSEQYCRDSKFPSPPALIFLLDVSYNNVKSGLVSLLCERMMEILGEVTNERARIGFITYASSVQFYNIKSSLVKPELLEVTDVHEMFMPLLDGFLGTVDEAGPAIQALMGQIPVLFQETKQTETLLLPAIQAGLEALKANETSGKLLVFNSSLPILEAPGKLTNRDDRKMLGTDKEKTVLTPQNTQYNNLAQECVNSGVSVDMFIFNNAYVDLATIGQVSRLTGGQVYKYTYFQSQMDGERLVEDVKRNITRPTAYDAVMRVRTSTGIRPTDFYGHMFMSNTTDMELASMDCDKAIALELKHDDKLVPEEGVIIQVAFLYTSAYGVRKVRVHNLSLNCTAQMADIYRYCELDTLMNFLTKQCATKLCDTTPRALRDALVTKTATILATYRKHCASPGSSLGQLILPECLKLLPLYVNSLLRCDALSGGPEISLDDRSFALYSSIVMDIPSSVVYLYPHLVCLTDQDNDEVPTQERASFEKLRPDGAYLIDNSIYMFLWIGQQVNAQWVESVFGVPSPAQIDTDRSDLPELNNTLSRRVHDVIDFVRASRPRSMRLTIVRQKDKLEMVLRQFLIEDRGYTESQMSYVDFLCHIHKEIRSQLS